MDGYKTCDGTIAPAFFEMVYSYRGVCSVLLSTLPADLKIVVAFEQLPELCCFQPALIACQNFFLVQSYDPHTGAYKKLTRERIKKKEPGTVFPKTFV